MPYNQRSQANILNFYDMKEPIAGLEPATCSLRMKLTKSYSPFITVFSEDAKIHL